MVVTVGRLEQWNISETLEMVSILYRNRLLIITGLSVDIVHLVKS